MPLVKLLIATSLDGFIADRDGGIDWLFDPSGDYGIGAFMGSVEAVLMGRTTYDQALSFGGWPYGKQEAFVFTHHPPASPPPGPVTFVSGDPTPLVDDLRRRCTKDVWLMGGGRLVQAFRERGLIDEYHLAVHPILLGEGVPLFPGAAAREDLRLVESTPYPDGLLALRYARA